MGIETELEKLRKAYILVKPSKKLKEAGFELLLEKLEEKPKLEFTLFVQPAKSFALAVLFILVFGAGFLGLTKAAQGSLPGDPLYPVKRLSENILATISGDGQVKVERRAQEVVNIIEAKKHPNLVKEAVKEYKKAVSEAKKELEKPETKKDFTQTLKRQQEEFEEASKKDPAFTEDIKEAIEASKEGRNGDGEVKGVKERQDNKKDDEDKGKEGNEGDGRRDNDENRSGSNSGSN